MDRAALWIFTGSLSSPFSDSRLSWIDAWLRALGRLEEVELPRGICTGDGRTRVEDEEEPRRPPPQPATSGG